MFAKRVFPPAVIFILIVSSVVMILPEEALSDDKQKEALAPTRTIVDESESNNGWSSADVIPGTQGSYELHGNLTSGDNDFFIVNLNGGNGPNVDRIEIDYKYMDTDYSNNVVFVLIHGFYSQTNGDQPSFDNEILLDLKYYQEGFNWLGPAFAEAGYSGRYGVRIVAQNGSSPISGWIKYNFTVTVSSVSPTDNNNDEDNPAPITGGFSGSMDQNDDFMDWFEVIAPGPTHPTVVDLTLDLVNPQPNDTNTGLSTHYGIQMDLYIRYNSRSDPGVYTREKISISPNPTFQDAGLAATPYHINLRKNCTRIEIGMVMFTFGLDSRNPNLNQKQYSLTQGATSYTLSGDVYLDVPNKRPVLKDPVITPMKGRSSDTFRFSVTYIDFDNETPQQIWLYRNGEQFKPLSAITGGSSMNHRLGVEYFVEVPGTVLGKNKVHVMNFSASDGEDWALETINALGNFLVTVDDNTAPTTTKGEIFTVELSEDQDEEQLVVDELFTDPDAMNDLTFFINSSIAGWTTGTVDHPMFMATLVPPREEETETVLKITPKEDVHGSAYLELKAVDNGFGTKEAFVTLDIQIAQINDDPEIVRVERKTLDGRDSLTFEVKQLDKQELDILAEDRDGDTLSYSWNIEESLSDPVFGENYYINSTSGECWVIPDDPDVPRMEFTIAAEDGNGGITEVDIILEVEDINDPPTIKVPETRSTVEGEYLYINPEFSDPDLDGDELLVFSYDLGDLELVIPQNAVDFDLSTGRLVIKALTEEMNGIWEVTITVSDKEFESDSGTCTIEIQNINDKPEVGQIYPEIEDNNLTVFFTTGDASDEDNDRLTYIWDFGDGTPLVEGEDLDSIEHTYSKGGSYTVSLRVFDGEAYSEKVTSLISITDPIPDPDQDSDGMADAWELRYGLDPADPSDAALDLDNDGLTNLEEYNIYVNFEWDLNPWDPDTDDDGWKDGEEYTRSFDPTDKRSHPEDQYKDMPMVLYLVTAIIVFIALLVIITSFILMRRNKPRAIASMASPMDYQMMPPADTAAYPEALPQEQMQSLPPAQMQYDQQVQQEGYYQPQEQQYDQDYQYQDQTQEYPGQDQYYQQDHQIPDTQAPSEGYDEQQPYYQQDHQTPEAPPPSPQGTGVTPPVEGADIPMTEEPNPEDVPSGPPSDTPDETSEDPGPEEVKKGEEGEEDDPGSKGIPPPPDIPDL